MNDAKRYRSSWRHTAITLAVTATTVMLSHAAYAQRATTDRGTPGGITFTKDVAPILQDKCEVCHRPGEMAPMSLVTYEDVRPWARSIRTRVAAREMPPWHLDRTVGIQKFQNDRSLSDQQINTIVRWVDEGTPRGNLEDLPPAKQWPNADIWHLESQFGKPDLVVRSPAFTMPARSADQWLVPVVPTGLTEDRWVRAIETRPSHLGRKIVHHADVFLLQTDDADPVAALPEGTPPGGVHFSEWAVGKFGDVYRPNTGKLMKAGSQIRFDLHYHSVGEEIRDQIEVAFYFYPKGVVPQYRVYMTPIGGSAERNLDIPPNKVIVNHAYFSLRAPARLENFQPHMHMRGKAMMLEAVYPDGRSEVISYCDHFDFNWHNNYVYTDDAAPVLPKGTVLHVTAWHDNTSANKNNPDPTQWVGTGSRSIDEMLHLWVNITYLTEQDYQRTIAERKKAAAASTGQQQ